MQGSAEGGGVFGGEHGGRSVLLQLPAREGGQVLVGFIKHDVFLFSAVACIVARLCLWSVSLATRCWTQFSSQGNENLAAPEENMMGSHLQCTVLLTATACECRSTLLRQHCRNNDTPLLLLLG